MNDERRKRIREQVINPLTAAMDALDEINEEEEEYVESIPESFEEKRQAAEEVVYVLGDIKEEIETQKNAAAELIGDDG